MDQGSKDFHNRIPIAVSLNTDFKQQDLSPAFRSDKKRLLFIMCLAVGIAALISVIAKGLVYLIDLITNIAFHQVFSIHPSSPATNHYGLWVILIPALGGIGVGLMALYG